MLLNSLKSDGSVAKFSGFRIAPILFFLVFTIQAQTFSAQTDTTKFVVGKIKIFGNEITKDYVILDELPFAVGDTISKKDLRYAKERVYSLKLFNFVDFVTDNKNPRRIIILVKEAWYIFPLPFVVFRKNSIKYSNYGINLLWKNFRGRNETINATLSFGFDPNFYASYFNPNFIERNVRLSFGGGLISLSNKSQTFEQNVSKEKFSTRSYFTMLGLGYRFTLKNTFDAFFTYRNFSLDKSYANEYFGTNDEEEKSIALSLNFNRDTRDLKLNAKSGYLLSVVCGYNHFFDIKKKTADFPGYANLFAELRNYFTLNKHLILRTKLKGRILPVKSYVPYYDKSYFGYTKFVRGHAFDKSEGDNYFFASAELVIPLIENLRYTYDAPILPTALTSARIGAQIVVFFDAGKTFDETPGGRIPFGYGAGFHLLLMPYDVLKFDFAWNEKGKWEFLFGTGFYF